LAARDIERKSGRREYVSHGSSPAILRAISIRDVVLVVVLVLVLVLDPVLVLVLAVAAAATISDR
jgi:hypothetical protein